LSIAHSLGQRTHSLCDLSMGLRAEFHPGLGVYVGMGRKGLVPGPSHFERVSTSLVVFLFHAESTSSERQAMAHSPQNSRFVCGLVHSSIYDRRRISGRESLW